MGEPGDGDQVTTYIGISRAKDGVSAKLSEAFESAAGQAIRDHVIGEGPDGATAWFQVTLLEVELGNQHPKTVKVGVTKKDPS
jgi:hypothetical protein